MKNRKRCRRKTQKNRRDQKQFSEDLSTKQCSSSVREYSDPIPVDVLIDIFSRVSATSIARFRCVSKLWESILGRPDFTELFLTKSLARPRLLFIFEANEKLYAFSSPQPQNPHENTTLVATPYKCFPKHTPTSIRTVHCGLVFLRHWGNSKVWMISNPVTDEIITLPEVKVAGNRDSFLGFDPISKQFKVLCMSWSRSNTHRRSKTPNTHWILTLETGKLFWRTVQDPILPHFPSLHVDGVCINGVLYYGAFFFPDNTRKIVCFDFRFEKFSFITLDKDMCPTSPLFNYKGKLGAHQYIGPFHNSKSVLLWVLEDGEKHKWTKHICILPSVVFQNNKFVGMMGTGELVFSPCTCNLSQPFYIFFYNIEKETYTRVHIQGFEEFKKDDFTYVQTSLDFVEDMKFI